MIASIDTGLITLVRAVPLWLPVAWIVLLVTASIIIRRRRGQHVFDPPCGPALFREEWRSGNSLANPIFRHWAAGRLLRVEVTFTAIRVLPHFPFNLGFFPDFWGLEHVVDPSSVVSVKRVADGWLGRGRVRLSYRCSATEVAGVEVQLRDPAAFVAAVKAARALPAPPPP